MVSREFCPWCFDPFDVDDRTIEQWPCELTCRRCHGGILLTQNRPYTVRCGNAIPPEAINQLPRI